MNAVVAGLRSFVLVIAGVVVPVLIACSSVPEISFPDGDASGEGGIVDPNCKRTGPEDCTDGLDNDCNGKTDCADPACTSGFSCQDAPADWKLIAFADNAQPACPPDETPTALKVSASDGSASCTCTCTPVGGGCAGGNFTLTQSNDTACGALSTANVPTSSGCAGLPTKIAVSGNHVKIAPQAPSMCAPNSAPTGSLTNGRLCEPAKVGGGCAANQVCAPKPTTGLASCVTKTGKSVCPAGFTKRSTAGTDAMEGRSCSGCTCNGPAPCVGGSVSLFDNKDCAKAGAAKKATQNITSTCAAAQPDTGYEASFFMASPPTGGCAAAPATPATATGSISFTGERTVCCK